MRFLKKVFQSKRCLTVTLLSVLSVLSVAGVVVFFVKYLNPNLDSVDPEKLNSVKEAYLQEKLANGYSEDMTLDDIYIVEYYGIYRDCIVVMLMDRHTAYTQAIGDETIAGVKIRYNDANRIVAYKDGVLYMLQEAYDMGFLTKANIKRIKNVHDFPDKKYT